jgi:hypothetical protein
MKTSTRLTAHLVTRAIAPALLIATFAVPTGVATAGDTPSGDRSAVPADFVTLTDDTNALTISVPSAWSDVDTAPGTNDDGTVMPWISAAPDYTAFIETFDVPGALFIGVTYTTDLQSWITRIGQPQSCQMSSSEGYDDGAFVGTATSYEQCGPNQVASLMVLAANAGDDTTRTYVLAVQASAPDDVAMFEPVLASFHAVGITQPVNDETAPPTTDAPAALPAPAAPDAPGQTPITLPDGTPLVPALPPGVEGAPTTTVAAAPPATAAVPTTAASGATPTSAPGAAPTSALPAPAPVTTVGAAPTTAAAGPFTPTNSLAVGAVQVTDDTRTITVAVPPDWVETATTASVAGLPQILAGPQLAGFAPGGAAGQAFASAGVQFTASPFTADTASAVTVAASVLPCTQGTVQPYEDPVFTGHIVQLTDCGGTTTRVYVVAANPAEATLTASLLIQVTDFDDSDLQTILSSFDIAREDSPGTVPATTTVATPTTAATAPTTAPVAPITAAVPPTTAVAVPTTVSAPTTVPGTPGVYSPPASIPGDTLEVVDDTGLIRVGVPPAWVDRRTTSFTNANGGLVPQIVASASVAAFIPGDSAVPDPNGGSGVVFSAVPYAADPAATLGAFAQLHSDCAPGIVQQYQDPVFTGVIQEFTACGGTQTRRFVVVASPADQRFTALVTVQVTDDPSILGTVLATFDYDPNVQLPG